ncbi:lysylphosphatidylglycerol synthase transmembrane domain-containing protein [Rhizobium sp. FKY42]|uniref:lysylphosphatidylglycerol synthase transmembrane domain-containing protein n=1 Tax=Rhizobium sp. FKY42 TaxID=2562310 RepID=UPI0010C0192C|nr:lysylphosphatidylglycerol synthase transmembrane domain-containing protein [Rhizobium sp. FKY42]
MAITLLEERSPILKLVRIFGTALALILAAWVVWRTDWSIVLKSLSSVSLVHLSAGLLLVQFQICMSAFRWRYTALRIGQPIGKWQAVREYYLSTGLNQLMPGGVAGDAIRAYRGRAQDGSGLARSATSVILERLSGQAALLMFVLVGLLLWPDRINGYDKWAVLAVVGVVAAVLCLAVLPVMRTRFKGLASDLHAAFCSVGAAGYQLTTSVLIVTSYIALFMLCAHATGSPLTIGAALMVVPLCLLTMVLPSGFGGWGTREAAAAALWPMVGYTADQGIAASLLYGAVAMLGAAPSLLVFFTSRGR